MKTPRATVKPREETGVRAAPRRPAAARAKKPIGTVSSASPLGALALELLARRRQSKNRGLVFIAGDERRAEQLGAILYALDPDCDPMVIPRLDSAFDASLAPSRDVAGRRASVLRRLAEDRSSPLVIATAEALMRRVPRPADWAGAALRIAQGDAIDPDALKSFLDRAGYALDERVDLAGTAMFQGQVVDIFPAGAVTPARLHIADGRVSGLSSYDPDSQRQTGELASLVLDLTSEMLAADRADATVFDYLPDADLLRDHGVDRRAATLLQEIDAFSARSDSSAKQRRRFLDEAAWNAAIGGARSAELPRDTAHDKPVPRFAIERSPVRALRAYVSAREAQKHRIVFAAASARDLRTLERRAAGIGVRCATWSEVLTLRPGARGAMLIDLERGFVVDSPKPVTVIAAADVLGSRAARMIPMGPAARWSRGGWDTITPGDLVVHLDRGLGVLRGLQTVSAPDLPDRDMVRLDFADDASVLVPVHELASVWRYGAATEGVPLDKADGSSWSKRRIDLNRQIAETAGRLAEIAARRAESTAEKIVAPAADYERFAGRFPYVLTPDQGQAIEDVLTDLASGRPMDRLVCGDVGFGKTEIALRAAAAAVFAGKQVAIAVPTTVLARQHVESFRKRFAPFGVEVGHLSRFVAPAEARAVRQRLADGSLRIVIGTHAIAAKNVRFKELALLVLDEEQRFGAAEKEKLAALGENVHVLMLTATPIPRTLSLAAIGLRSLSVLATPPARRVPVKTVVEPFHDPTARDALRREWRRGGQSFVVCPRVADIAPMQRRLTALVPELGLRVLHGRMPGEVIDKTMVDFAGGDGDVLLTTNIIESGLDLPRANTIIVYRPDRFGLAQLHQLRGRVGRGDVGAFAYFCSEPDDKLTAAAVKRLKVLGELSDSGAGFDISDRDLDLRGTGDLLGEDQAGHINLVGPSLYRHLLQQALASLRGEAKEDSRTPELRIDVVGVLPRGYIEDEKNRLEIYERAFKADAEAELDDLEEEIEDRFGEPPAAARDLMALGRINIVCKRLRITKLEAGPHALALSFEPAALPAVQRRARRLTGAEWSDARLLLVRPTKAQERLAAVAEALEQLDG